MCETLYCVDVWLPDSIIVVACLAMVTGLIVWKLVKALIDTIPVVG